MTIDVTESAEGNEISIIIDGNFDISIYQTFSDAYKDKLKKDIKVKVDFGKTNYMDSSGLGMLLLLRERCQDDAINGDIEIINCKPTILNILKTVNFDKLFTIK